MVTNSVVGEVRNISAIRSASYDYHMSLSSSPNQRMLNSASNSLQTEPQSQTQIVHHANKAEQDNSSPYSSPMEIVPPTSMKHEIANEQQHQQQQQQSSSESGASGVGSSHHMEDSKLKLEPDLKSSGIELKLGSSLSNVDLRLSGMDLRVGELFAVSPTPFPVATWDTF